MYITAPHIVPIPTLTTIEERQEDSLENLEPGKTVGPAKMILADTLDMNKLTNTSHFLRFFSFFCAEAVPYGWWTSSPEKPTYKGFDESLIQLREVLEKQARTTIHEKRCAYKGLETGTYFLTY